MNKYPNTSDETLETAADLWFQQWVEESTNDFANVELDDFILID